MHAPTQLTLFPLDAIETVAQADRLVDLPDGSWEVRLDPPRGRGWRVVDARHERRTIWQRRFAVPAFRRRARP